MMNRILVSLLLSAIVGLVGCNTMNGAGKDIQRGGRAVSDTARDVQSGLWW